MNKIAPLDSSCRKHTSCQQKWQRKCRVHRLGKLIVSACAALEMVLGLPSLHAQTTVTNTNTTGGWVTNNGTTNWTTGGSGYNSTNFSTAALAAALTAVFTNTSSSIGLGGGNVYLNNLSYTPTASGNNFTIGSIAGDGTLSFTGASAAITNAAGSETLTVNSAVALATNITINNGNGANLNLNGNISGAGTMTFAGAGTTTMAGNNSNGTITISSGGLVVSTGTSTNTNLTIGNNIASVNNTYWNKGTNYVGAITLNSGGGSASGTNLLTNSGTFYATNGGSIGNQAGTTNIVANSGTWFSTNGGWSVGVRSAGLFTNSGNWSNGVAMNLGNTTAQGSGAIVNSGNFTNSGTIKIGNQADAGMNNYVLNTGSGAYMTSSATITVGSAGLSTTINAFTNDVNASAALNGLTIGSGGSSTNQVVNNGYMTNGTISTFAIGQGASGVNIFSNSAGATFTNGQNFYIGNHANSTGTNELVNNGTIIMRGNYSYRMGAVAGTINTQWNLLTNNGNFTIVDPAQSFTIGYTGVGINQWALGAGTLTENQTHLYLGAGAKGTNLITVGTNATLIAQFIHMGNGGGGYNALTNGGTTTLTNDLDVGSYGNTGTIATTNAVYQTNGTLTAAKLNIGSQSAVNGGNNTNSVTVTGGQLRVNGPVTFGAAVTAPTGVSDTITMGGGTFTANAFVNAYTNGSYTNQIIWNGGTLQAGATSTNFLPNMANTLVMVSNNGGTFDLNGQSDTIAANITNNNGIGTLTLTNTSSTLGTLTLSGANSEGLLIGGNLAMVFSGSGTTTLNASNNYSGATTISGGTLDASLGTVGTNNLTMNGATLKVGGNQSVGQFVVGAGNSLINAGGGTLTIANLLQVYANPGATNALEITNGTLLFSYGASSSNNNVVGPLGPANGGVNTLQIDSNAALSMTNANQRLYVGYNSNGTLVTNSGTNSIIVNGGSLSTLYGVQFGYNAGQTNALNELDVTNNGQVTFTGGQIGMNIGSANMTDKLYISSGSVTGTATTVLGSVGNFAATNAQSIITNGGGNLTLGAVTFGSTNTAVNTSVGITNTIALGAGTTTANSFANAYTNGSYANQIIWNGGTLQAGASSASFLPNMTSTLVMVSNNGGTFDLNGQSDTIAANITNNAGVGTLLVTNTSVSTPGTLTLTGTNSETLLIGGNLAMVFGGGSTTLSGSNNYTGGTTLSGGNLYLGSSNAIGSGSLTIAGGTLDLGASTITNTLGTVTGGTMTNGTVSNNGGTFSFANNGSTNVIVAANLAGTDGLTQSGTGTTTLSGSNSYTGGTVINAGQISVGNSNALGLSSAALNVAAGTLNLGGYNISAGAFSIGNGTLAFTAGGGTLTASSFTASNSTSTSINLSNSLVGDGATFTQSGGGTTTLSASNSYTGGTLLKAGVLVLGNNGALGSSGALTFNGGTLKFSSTNTTDYSGRFATNDSQAYKFDLNGQNITLANGITNGGSTSLSVTNSTGTGTLTLAGANSFAGAIANNASALNLSNSANQTLAGAISGSGALIQSGAATTTLNGNNNYTGATTITNGSLVIGASGLLGGGTYNGAIGIATNSGLFLSQSAAQTLGGVISGAGSITVGGGSTTTLGAVNTYSGGTTVTNGSTLVIANSQNLVGTMSISSNSLVNFNGGGTIGSTGAIGLTVSGAGTLEISKSLNFGTSSTGAGGGIVSMSPGGLIWITGNSAVIGGSSGRGDFSANQASLQIDNGSSFTLGDKNVVQQFDALNGSGIFSGGVPIVRSVNIGVANGSGTFTGVISTASGLFSLQKSGTGTQVLSGANTYNGVTTISGGVLQIGNGGTTGTLGSGAVVNYASLVFNRSDATVVSNAISGTGSLTQSGQGTTTLAGNNTYSGGTILNAGVLALGTNTAIGSLGALTFSGGTLQFSSANTNDYSARFATKANQAYSFDLNGQNIKLANGITNGGSTSLSVTDSTGSGTLTLAGVNSFTGSITNNASALNLSNSANQTLAGAISGSGALIQSGAATTTLSGNNSYTGGTIVNGGMLLQSNANALGSTNGSISVSAGTLNLGGYTDTNSSFTISGGKVTNGTMVAATYALQGGTLYSTLGSGAITVSTGTTTLGSAGRFNSGSSLNITGGQLVLGGDEGVASFTQSGGTLGTNNSTRTLTAATYTLNGGTINGLLGTGAITVSTGATTLGSAGRFYSGSSLNIASGTLNLGGNENVSSFTNAGGTLAGSGTLTAATYQLNGGTVSANLGLGTVNVGGNAILSGTAAASTVNVNSGSLLLSGGDDRLATGGTVAVSGGATLNLGGNNQTLAGLTGNGVVTNSANTLTLNVSSGINTFGGSIRGAGGLTKSGNGAVTLSGNSSYSGATVVNGGLLTVNGTNSSSTVLVNNSATLSGSGSVGAVTVANGGTVTPANTSAGALTPGALAVSSMVWNGGGNFNWLLNDVTGVAGTGYSTFSSLGRLDLTSLNSSSPFNINLWTTLSSGSSGSALNFDSGNNYSWTLGTFAGGITGFSTNEFIINTSATNGTGGFANAFTGDWGLIANANSLILTYTKKGGDSWSGGSGNLSSAGITNNANLTFSGAGGSVTNNAVTSLQGITFSNSVSSPVTLTGNALANGSGGIVNNSGVSNAVNVNLTLSSDQTFAASSNDLSVGGTVDNSGYTLTVSGSHNTTFNSGISGAGGLTKLGSGTATLNSPNTFTGQTTINDGTLALGNSSALGGSTNINLGQTGHNGTLDATALGTNGLTIATGQTLAGNGTVNLASGGALKINGNLSPGNSPGVITVNGDLALGSSALTTMQVAGFGAAGATNGFDQVNIIGNFQSGGLLVIHLLNPMVVNDTTLAFREEIFNATSRSGNFTNVQLLFSGTLNGMNVSNTSLEYYSANNTWQVWSTETNNYGQPLYYAGINMDTGYLTVVPEPSSYLLFGFGSLLTIAITRGRRNRN